MMLVDNACHTDSFPRSRNRLFFLVLCMWFGYFLRTVDIMLTFAEVGSCIIDHMHNGTSITYSSTTWLLLVHI